MVYELMNITIMGSGNTLQKCIWDAPNTEYWATSSALISSFFKYADFVFELHNANYYLQPKIIKRLNDTGLPVMMKTHVSEIPLSRRLPVKQIINKLNARLYFTSSIPYIIAYAIYKEFKTINFFGIDLLMDSEYAFELPSCAYWIGIAEGKGIKVNIPEDSALCHAPLYSYTKESLC